MVRSPLQTGFPSLPPYHTFYSELKQRYVLEVRHKKDDDDVDDGNEYDQMTKYSVQDDIVSCMTFGEIEA